jgi:hypothetical protein
MWRGSHAKTADQDLGRMYAGRGYKQQSRRGCGNTCSVPPVAVAVLAMRIPAPIARCVGINSPRNHGRGIYNGRSCVNRSRLPATSQCWALLRRASLRVSSLAADRSQAPPRNSLAR